MFFAENNDSQSAGPQRKRSITRLACLILIGVTATVFTGALTKNSHVKRPFDDDGVSCIACHSIQSANGRGIGGYTMGEPALLIKEDGTRMLAGVSDQQILDDIPSHRRAMMRPLLKTPEFCGSCHKSQVPRELNDYKFLRAFMVADELQQSSFSKESPHPFYVRDKETCNSCHMKREPAPLAFHMAGI